MTASAKTLRALERAAMRWYCNAELWNWTPKQPNNIAVALYKACAAHAAALKRKPTGGR